MLRLEESDFDYAQRYSHFVQTWIKRLGISTFAEDSPLQWTTEYLEQLLSDCHTLDEKGFWTALRLLRQRIVVSLAVADLNRKIPLSVVMQTMSVWADVAIQVCLRYYTPRLIQRYGEPKTVEGHTMPLWVIGMGKLGGHELNVSSDIDLIFLYESEGSTAHLRPMSHSEFFTELGKKLISALNSVTDHGQVFRVDMRLRPYGDSGPLVMSLEALENYFSTQGRLWERYAWVRARLINQDLPPEALATFIHHVHPFVYRRYWDFSAYEGLRDMYAKIRTEGQRKDYSQHIKIGEGGIRYVEFIAQLFQLIRGGRKPELRGQKTLHILDLLASMDILEAEACEHLQQDYIFLRELEHRLQYRDDQQTHTLPSTEEGWDALTSLYPEYTTEGLQEHIRTVRERVNHYFSTLVQINTMDSEVSPGVVPPMPLYSRSEPLAKNLEELGLPHDTARRTAERLAIWMKSLRFRRLPARSQTTLEHVLPYLIKASIDYGETALFRALDVLEAVSARSSYVALFREHPPVLDRLLRVLSASSWASSYLSEYPLLLDELIHGMPDPESLGITQANAELHRVMSQAIGEEQMMENLRHWQRIQTFRCLCCDIANHLSVESVSDYLSWIADQIIDYALRGAWYTLPQQHCDAPKLAVLAYGKLGGKELGYSSDIDIVFLYDDPFDLAPVRYARLTQKWIHWMTALTPAGRLYEVDMRLRPEGESGLLIASWAAFERYQQERAQLWEHQALTRARWVAGDTSLKIRFDALRSQLLSQKRELSSLWESIRAMRDKMRQQHSDLSRHFDVKKSRGGMIDIEFVVQYFVLGWSHQDPTLLSNIGNIALLRHIGRTGYIDHEIADRAADTYRELRAIQHQCQLQGMEGFLSREDSRIPAWQQTVESLYNAAPKSESIPQTTL
jgi:[glutamine synthetase] adenylyltransferase / [glutamine synthetase]-adenylyl-L-tyrosine phosphorylase